MDFEHVVVDDVDGSFPDEFSVVGADEDGIPRRGGGGEHRRAASWAAEHEDQQAEASRGHPVHTQHGLDSGNQSVRLQIGPVA